MLEKYDDLQQKFQDTEIRLNLTTKTLQNYQDVFDCSKCGLYHNERGHTKESFSCLICDMDHCGFCQKGIRCVKCNGYVWYSQCYKNYLSSLDKKMDSLDDYIKEYEQNPETWWTLFQLKTRVCRDCT